MAAARKTSGLFTVVEAARWLEVSPVTIRRRIRAGKLRALKNGRLIRIRLEDLEAMCTRQEAVGWGNLSAEAFLRDWDNPYDAIYDDWRRRVAPAKR